MRRASEEENCKETNEESLSIEVSNRCNSACLHCFVRAGISERSSLPAELVKRVIFEGYNIAYQNLHITGGEPLLWDGLFDTLDYAFNLGYIKEF